MAVSINYLTKVINVPKPFMTLVTPTLYELDVNALRLALKDLEDDPDGMFAVDTHRHNTAVSLSGVTYARIFEVINGYTVEFEDGQYAVKCVGANHNLADVKVLNQVSLIIGNSAGLVEVGTGGSGSSPTAAQVASAVWSQALEGLTAEEMMRIMLAALAGKRQGLGTPTEEYMAQDGLTPRVTLVADTAGNGTPVLNGAP
jgi:hypothetical protein